MSRSVSHVAALSFAAETGRVPLGMARDATRPSTVVFQIKSAILVRISRVDQLPPDRSLRCDRKLRVMPHSRFAPQPNGLAGS